MTKSIFAALPKAKTSAVAVDLKDPVTGEVINVGHGDVKVYVHGKASKVHRDFTDAKVKAYAANKSKNKNEINMDKIRKDSVEFAVACTEKITGLQAEDITSKESIEELYSTEEFHWVLDQVNSAIENEANFF